VGIIADGAVVTTRSPVFDVFLAAASISSGVKRTRTAVVAPPAALTARLTLPAVVFESA
jgi:hypothetical protein